MLYNEIIVKLDIIFIIFCKLRLTNALRSNIITIQTNVYCGIIRV